jgi:hypothetical protein
MEMQFIRSIHSTQNRCKDIEQNNKTQDLDYYITLVILTSYINTLKPLQPFAYEHMPPIQQVALYLDRLHTTYVTFFYISYN